MRHTIHFTFSLRKGRDQARLHEMHTLEDSGVARKVVKSLTNILCYGISSDSMVICETVASTIIDVSVEWTMSRERSLIDCADFFWIIKGNDLLENWRDYPIQITSEYGSLQEKHWGVVVKDRICMINVEGMHGPQEVFPMGSSLSRDDFRDRRGRALERSVALKIRFGDLV